MKTSQKPPITVDLGDGITMTFRHIPAGCFRMGQRGSWTDDDEVAELRLKGHGTKEDPVTEVVVEEFWMGETPITQEQYRMMASRTSRELENVYGYLGVSPSKFLANDNLDGQRPVVGVCWHEARIVGRWLAGEMKAVGLLPVCYSVDLPSEAQWEYACRAGTETEYYSGDGKDFLRDVGRFGEDGLFIPYPVKSKALNRWGLADLHGSVWQRCRDSWDDFGDWGEMGEDLVNVMRLMVPHIASEEDRFDVISAGWHAMRGGSWVDSASLSRTSLRFYSMNDNRDWTNGFRLCLTAIRR